MCYWHRSRPTIPRCPTPTGRHDTLRVRAHRVDELCNFPRLHGLCRSGWRNRRIPLRSSYPSLHPPGRSRTRTGWPCTLLIMPIKGHRWPALCFMHSTAFSDALSEAAIVGFAALYWAIISISTMGQLHTKEWATSCSWGIVTIFASLSWCTVPYQLPAVASKLFCVLTHANSWRLSLFRARQLACSAMIFSITFILIPFACEYIFSSLVVCDNIFGSLLAAADELLVIGRVHRIWRYTSGAPPSAHTSWHHLLKQNEEPSAQLVGLLSATVIPPELWPRPFVYPELWPRPFVLLLESYT